MKLLIDLWLSGVILKFREFCTLARNFNYEPRLVGVVLDLLDFVSLVFDLGFGNFYLVEEGACRGTTCWLNIYFENDGELKF